MRWTPCCLPTQLVSQSSSNSVQQKHAEVSSFSQKVMTLADAQMLLSDALFASPVSLFPTSGFPLPSRSPGPPPIDLSLCSVSGDQLPLASSSQPMSCTPSPLGGRLPTRFMAILPRRPRARFSCEVSKRLICVSQTINKIHTFFLPWQSSSPSSWKFGGTLLMFSDPGKQTIRSFLKHFILQWEQGEGIWVGAVFLTTETNCRFLLDGKCQQAFL